MNDRQQIGITRWVLWLTVRAFWTLVSRVCFRPRITGREHLPRHGAYLLLANHTSTFDTLWVSQPLGRPAHFMTSASLFRNPVAGRILPLLGAFPKEVGKKDRRSAANIQRLYDGGAIIQIMPEGARTWDGRLQPVGEGLGRLVQRLDARVVVCRVDTGHWCWPRWATWPRWVPLHLHFHAPRTWSTQVNAAQIRDEIVQQMTPVTPKKLRSTLCFRPAEGLPVYLYGCPQCGHRPTRARKAILSCDGCGAGWTVGSDMTLTPLRGGAQPFTLADAYDAMRAHYGSPMRDRAGSTSTEGVALEAGCQVLSLRRGATAEVLSEGPLALSSTGLNSANWSLGFTDIRSIHMDAGNVLNLRVEEGLVRVVPDDGQTWMWENFIRSWWEQPKASA